ncbi:MAG TPA: PQQ-dependent sugar dehydrogenase, partial [Pirellulales bacterium]|nr:PQQ-dependent sugar dehydrogenase [Pirellulales bacterium]
RGEQPPAPRPAWTTSRIKGSPVPPAPYRIALAFPRLKFDRPTSVEELPDGRLIVTEMSGKVFSFLNQTDASDPNLVLDLTAMLPAALAGRGVSLFDAEPHPKFNDNHFLFVCYVHPADGGHTRVSRFTLDGESPPRVVPHSEQVVITWPAGGHNGGCLEFAPDGCLFISTGDGAGPNPPDALTTGQDVSDLLGAVLRIDVDHASGNRPYTVPTDNPFVDVTNTRPEIWAYGLRNPWKFGIDPESGDTFAADNGWETWEMVHRIVRGGNCGWPVMEGRVSLRSEVKLGPTPILPPVKDHPHTEANSVIGGPVYRGQKLPGLVGSFVYGDYITGTIWAVQPDEDGSYSCTTLVDTDQRIVAFTQTRGGQLFVLDYDFTGQVYELLPSNEPDTSASFPRRLSETGLFASLKDLQPAAGVVAYDVIASRWLDGAAVRRWVAVPGASTIELANQGKAASYPEGTVFVNHLSFAPAGAGEPVPLETQLLHYERGSWRPYSYLWDESGHDAQLVEPIGAKRTLRLPDTSAKGGLVERTWHVNAVNECKACHNAESGYVLGFTPHQLNRGAPDSASSSQLKQLAGQRVLSESPTIAHDDPAQLVDPHDATAGLNDRARSYLHVNCAVCHKPGGNAIVSFYLRRDLPFDKLNTNKGSGIGTFGLQDGKIIVPGDPFRSLLLYRMSKLGYARMPYIGSRVVDCFGVSLIEEWIESLPGVPTSAPLSSDTAEAIALQVLTRHETGDDGRSVIGELLKSTAGALALAVELHRGAMADDDARMAVSLGAAATSSDVRGLFETFVPESQRRATLGPNVDVEVVLRRQGDHERGKLIYFSDAARCRACHELNDRGKSLGPTLAEINKKYPSRAELLVHVLRPSQKIDDPFAAYSVATGDGRLLSGLLVEQNDRQIVLKTVEKQTVTLARDDVEEIVRSEKSLMPEGILSDLTEQEAADLLEYVRSCTK